VLTLLSVGFAQGIQGMSTLRKTSLAASIPAHYDRVTHANEIKGHTKHLTSGGVEQCRVMDNPQKRANRRGFVPMIYIEIQDEVLAWAEDHPRSTPKALRLWRTLLRNYEGKTGRIKLRREKIAELIGTHPNHVSAMLSELVDKGILERRMDGTRAEWFFTLKARYTREQRDLFEQDGVGVAAPVVAAREMADAA
jgi:DNA-binding MarR family transcriptional regulator